MMKRQNIIWVCIVFLIIGFFIVSCQTESGDVCDQKSGPAIYSVTASPTEDEQVTLINCGDSQADISNWTLGDLNNPNTYDIPSGTILGPMEKKTFPHTTLNFQIDDSGEVIYLKDSMGNTIDTWSN
jgi:hypothetical protein